MEMFPKIREILANGPEKMILSNFEGSMLIDEFYIYDSSVYVFIFWIFAFRYFGFWRFVFWIFVFMYFGFWRFVFWIFGTKVLFDPSSPLPGCLVALNILNYA